MISKKLLALCATLIIAPNLLGSQSSASPSSSSSPSQSIQRSEHHLMLKAGFAFIELEKYDLARSCFRNVLHAPDKSQGAIAHASYYLGKLLVDGSGGERDIENGRLLLYVAARQQEDENIGAFARQELGKLANSISTNADTVSEPIFQGRIVLPASSSLEPVVPSISLEASPSPSSESPASSSGPHRKNKLRTAKEYLESAAKSLKISKFDRAIDYLKLAVKQTDDVHTLAEAQYKLGLLLATNRSTKDLQAAIALWNEAAKQAVNERMRTKAQEALDLLFSDNPKDATDSEDETAEEENAVTSARNRPPSSSSSSSMVTHQTKRSVDQTVSDTTEITKTKKICVEETGTEATAPTTNCIVTRNIAAIDLPD